MPNVYCLYKNQQYSNGSEVCQGTKLMRCEGGVWVDTGENCKESAEKSLTLGEIPEISEQARAEFTGGQKDSSHPTLVAERWGLLRTLTQDKDYVYFRGSRAQSLLCVGTYENYQIPNNDFIRALVDGHCKQTGETLVIVSYHSANP